MNNGNCKECGCELVGINTRPDGSQNIGCTNCPYTIELGFK